jgi:hypothetical protein
MIAAAILVTNHWLITFTQGDLTQMVRFNRWTGGAEICWLDPDTIKAERSLVGAKYQCGDLPLGPPPSANKR